MRPVYVRIFGIGTSGSIRPGRPGFGALGKYAPVLLLDWNSLECKPWTHTANHLEVISICCIPLPKTMTVFSAIYWFCLALKLVVDVFFLFGISIHPYENPKTTSLLLVDPHIIQSITHCLGLVFWLRSHFPQLFALCCYLKCTFKVFYLLHDFFLSAEFSPHSPRLSNAESVS